MTAVSTGRSLETLTAEDFRGHHDTWFRLTGGPYADSPVTIDTVLAGVTEYPARSGTLRAPFSVLFHGPLQPVGPQGIYRVEHAELGALELFIVPLGPDEPTAPGQAPTAMRYEAVFG